MLYKKYINSKLLNLVLYNSNLYFFIKLNILKNVRFNKFELVHYKLNKKSLDIKT